MINRNTLPYFGWFSLFLLLGRGILAQPTIEADINLTVGDRGPVQAFSQGNNVFDAGSAGANVSWDFTNVTALGTEIEWEAVDPSQTHWTTDFPDANLAFHLPQDSGSDTRYYKISASEVLFLGWVSVLNSDSLFYDFNDDPSLDILYPMTYQDQVYDTARGNATVNFGGSNVVLDRTIIRNIKADAYGTLTTPSGTYNQVLRVRIAESVEDKTFGQTVGTQKNVRYFWYTPNEKYLLLQMDSLVIQNAGGNFPSFTMFYSSGKVITSLEDRQLEKDIHLYPQPIRDRLRIGLPSVSRELVQLQFYSLEGALIYKSSLVPDPKTSELILDINLPNGMYLLKLRQGKYSISRKIIVRN
ncbi:MAG: T9SS type A sorting domain-containing protein [Bacteroidia bacterium]|nr:T9SS type A sorting domain-containing protein [Bacteroidia bacterium]